MSPAGKDMHWLNYPLLSCFAALLAGCPGALEDPERFADCAPGFVENEIFVARCGNQVCHGNSDTPAADLDLVSAGVASRLIDIAGSAACGGQLLIDSSQPEASLLIDKLEAAPSCGSTMPLAAPPLTAPEIECVRRWIEQTAPAAGAREARSEAL